MANSYSQIYLQIVLVVKYRENLLQKTWRDDVFKYIMGIINNKGHKAIIVNGVADHVHILVGFVPSGSISDLVRDIKNNSSKYINDHNFLRGKFTWQGGYGVFSYSHSQLDMVYKYISNQEQHHKKTSFRDEYLEFLRKFEVDFDERYLFDWID